MYVCMYVCMRVCSYMTSAVHENGTRKSAKQARILVQAVYDDLVTHVTLKKG